MIQTLSFSEPGSHPANEDAFEVRLAITDGVWKYPGWEAILKTAAGKAGEVIRDSLRNQARSQRSGGFQDDFTLIVFRNDETLPAPTGPVPPYQRDEHATS